MFSDKYFFSKEYLSKFFKQKYDYGIYEYVLKIRMERAKELLLDDSIKIQKLANVLVMPTIIILARHFFFEMIPYHDLLNHASMIVTFIYFLILIKYFFITLKPGKFAVHFIMIVIITLMKNSWASIWHFVRNKL